MTCPKLNSSFFFPTQTLPSSQRPHLGKLHHRGHKSWGHTSLETNRHTGMYARARSHTHTHTHTHTPAPNSPCHYSPFSGEASSTFNSCAEFPWERDLTFVLESKGKIRWQKRAACGTVSPGRRFTLVPSNLPYQPAFLPSVIPPISAPWRPLPVPSAWFQPISAMSLCKIWTLIKVFADNFR